MKVAAETTPRALGAGGAAAHGGATAVGVPPAPTASSSPPSPADGATGRPLGPGCTLGVPSCTGEVAGGGRGGGQGAAAQMPIRPVPWPLPPPPPPTSHISSPRL